MKVLRRRREGFGARGRRTERGLADHEISPIVPTSWLCRHLDIVRLPYMGSVGNGSAQSELIVDRRAVPRRGQGEDVSATVHVQIRVHGRMEANPEKGVHVRSHFRPVDMPTPPSISPRPGNQKKTSPRRPVMIPAVPNPLLVAC
jgi:hypothetical protein